MLDETSLWLRDNQAVFPVDPTGPNASDGVGPFDHFTRDEWSAVAPKTPLPLTERDLVNLASLNDPIDLAEVDAIYRPLSAVLQLHVDATHRAAVGRRHLLGEQQTRPTPFVIGVAGSVAVGKSTVSRLLQLLLSRWQRTPHVDLITTDGFLLPNAELERRGILDRKGFPESYDRQGLIEFVARVKAGENHVEAPVYSHVTYDIVPGEVRAVDHPDILIVEGLNVLQPARTGPNSPGVGLSDYFDFTIYVDGDESDIEEWYVDRFRALRETAFTEPDSYFRNYADLTDAQAERTARSIWEATNLPNLRENIQPTRPRADLVLRKGADHKVEQIYLRKV